MVAWFDDLMVLPFSGVLMCTDVMARGVDFPAVDWVIQFDPPSSARYVGVVCAPAYLLACERIYLVKVNVRVCGGMRLWCVHAQHECIRCVFQLCVSMYTFVLHSACDDVSTIHLHSCVSLIQ